MASEPLKAQVARLLVKVGNDEESDFELAPCKAGGNNRVFTVTTAGRRLIAKWYFSHPTDSRDRLSAEYSFLRYAADAGIDCVPRPISCDAAHNLALYEFIEGTPVHAGEITQHEVSAALDFFLALNQAGSRSNAASLPSASEACFSINEHMAMVDMRIKRLDTISSHTPIDLEASTFAASLGARWQSVKKRIVKKSASVGINIGERLSASQRCVSPSDFGFHNALRRPSGNICFVDFEYGGWDDPAKMAGDFFSHPAVPVSLEFRQWFMDAAMRFCGEPATLSERANLLFPIFQLKWCCIILNDFLPDAALRRRFADPDFDESERKRAQLDKSIRLFESITPH